MHTRRILISVLSMALAAFAPHHASGGEIYRWVDEDGVIHFGEKTEAPPGAEPVEIEHGGSQDLGTTPSSGSTAPDPAYNSQASRAQQRRDERAAQRQAAAERQQEVAATCDRAYQRVASLEPSPRVLVEHEDGSVTRMDDDQRLELLAEAKAYIEEHCGN